SRMSSDSEYDSSAEQNDEEFDKELQAAFASGMLSKEQINIAFKPGQLQTRKKIVKAVELRQKTEEINKKLPWVEYLDVTSPCEMTEEIAKNDFQRELAFYKQAEHSAKIAVPRLQGMGVRVFRPTDYYAEMAKSDVHMQKIRKRLLDVQQSKDKVDTMKRLREEKRFASRVQKEAETRKLNEKKKLAAAVKAHRKGMKGQLEDMLNNARKMQLDEDEDVRLTEKRGGSFGEVNRAKKISRDSRDKRFGYGGQKKRMKHNDRWSNDNVFGKAIGARKGKLGGGKRK
ncbi:hypothetical protein PFISCL1PPCAC_6460, partial [Pristionchus fissidentatus]